MLYDDYRRKVVKLANVLDFIKRFRVPIIAVLALILTVITVLVSIQGIVYEVAACPATIAYGEELGYRADAVFGGVKYEFSAEGSDEWSQDMALRAGDYRVRAVAKGPFGTKRYGTAHGFTVAPKEAEVSVSQKKVGYGEVPSVFAPLAYEDEIHCARFVYGDPSKPDSTVTADVSSITVTSADGTDVTDCYVFHALTSTIGFIPRDITVTVQNADKIYDGSELTFDGYELSRSTPLAEGDKIVATFRAGRTDEGESENIPEIRIVKEAEGLDVTGNYNIDLVPGKLTVQARPLYVTTYGAEKVYDGTPLSCDGFEIQEPEEDSGLLSGHSISVSELCEVTDAKTADNYLGFLVRDDAGKDVSENYQIFYECGQLTVQPRPLSVSTGSGIWMYDGAAHRNPAYTVCDGENEQSGLLAGHSHALGVPDEIVEAGTKENATSICIFDETGKDVTGNYAVAYRKGTLTVTRRPVVIETAGNSWVYDGKLHTDFAHFLSDLSAYALADGDETRVEWGAGLSDCGSADNALDVRVFAKDGREVTESYDISYVTGTLTVTPRPIEVTAGSDEKIYDGTPLTTDKFTARSEYGAAIVENQTGVAVNEGAQTDAGTSANRVKEFTVTDGNRDVTFNYLISFAEGALTVKPRPVTVTAGSAEKIYDGKPLVVEECEVTCEYGAALVLNHRGVAHYRGSQTDAGLGINRIDQYQVFDGERDVTFNYKIRLLNGTLTVKRRPIEIASGSHTFVYDGAPHSNGEHSLSKDSEYPLVEGHVSTVVWANEITDVGETENSVLVAIYDGGREVTFNYLISYIWGTLEVTPRPITVKVQDNEKVYDGRPLSTFGITVTSSCEPPIVEGHTPMYLTEGSQTDVGTGVGFVSEFAIFDGNGRDVTFDYEVTFLTGVLIITPRPVLITAASLRDFYNGRPQSNRYATAEEVSYDPERGMLNWHALYADTLGSRTDVGAQANTVVEDSVRILEDGRNVTFNYALEFADGVIEVIARPIIITAGSAEKQYDGTPLTCADYSITSPLESLTPAVAEGERAKVSMRGSITEIGKIPNVVDKVQIFSGSRDVTANYNIVTESGLLVVQIPDGMLYIKTHAAEKVYDGTPLTCALYECENTLPDTYSVEISCDGSVTNVNKVLNTVSVTVLGPTGENVSDYIRVEYEYGILAVTPRPILVETNSNSWPYDGRLHSDRGHRISDKSDYTLAQGHETRVYGYTYIFDVGVKTNVLDIGVVANGFDVSENYLIEYDYGFLEIVESDYEGQGGSELDKDGNIGDWGGQGGSGGDGGNDGGGGEERIAAKVYSEFGGKIYLRVMSYGDYTGTRWNRASSYEGRLDNDYSLNYLTGVALEKAGYVSSLVRIDAKSNDYFLPYYMGLGEYDYTIQASDVWYQGDSRAIYELQYYPYDYVSQGRLNVDLGEYRDAEMAYRFYVKQNYLQIPGSTLAYLKKVIAKEGFDRNDDDIIKDVADYIQNAAQYNLSYNRLMNGESDQVVSFLRDYKEGVCRHFASAATMLYRALGIPARYTIGYAGDVSAGQWTDIYGANAHAWVEVYIDGLGWVQVEVTGAGPVFGGSGEGGDVGFLPRTIEIKPVDAVKQYDGSPLYAGAVEGAGKDRLTLRELLFEGYFYSAEFDGSRTEIGQSRSSIVSFSLYRPNGQKEEKIKFVFRQGMLRVVEEHVVTVHPYSLQKYYDGTPLVYQKDEYYVTGLPTGYTLRLSLAGVGMTDAGILSEDTLYALPLQIVDGAGVECTGGFYVCFDTETLMMVSRRKVALSSMSESKVYDGTPLTCGEYWISEGSLAENHTLSLKMTSSITDIGEIPNSMSDVRIVNTAGKDVTKNYRIAVRFGTLSILSD